MYGKPLQKLIPPPTPPSPEDGYFDKNWYNSGGVASFSIVSSDFKLFFNQLSVLKSINICPKLCESI